MSIIARDPHFSWSSPLADDTSSEVSSTDVSHSKQLERRLVNIWKTLTRATRKQKRVSVYAKDFVFVTASASRRRSIMALQHSPHTQPRSQPYPSSQPLSHSGRGHHTL